MRKTRLVACITVALTGLLLMLGMVHGGGLDNSGGHHDRKNGGYHFHRGPLVGRQFGSRSEAEQALRNYQESQKPKETAPTTQPAPKPAPTGAEKPATPQEEVLVLKRLLIEKGLMTEAEFKRTLQLIRDEAKKQSP